MNKEKIVSKLNNALDAFMQNEKNLLELDVNERSISHKLAEYLQKEFIDLNVDCEYNRNLDLIKKIDLPKDNINWDDMEAKTIFPDIIVHKRNTSENILVIEIKKTNNRVDRNLDKKKLIAFTKQDGNYKYQLGAFIEFDTRNKSDTILKFENGKEIE